MKTIGIIGTRMRDSKADLNTVIDKFFEIYKEGDRIVSGGCPDGADWFAEEIAKGGNIPIIIHYADWKTHGKAAGFIRNGDIAKDADILIACVKNPGDGIESVLRRKSGGTEDTLKKFVKRDFKLKAMQNIYLV